MKTRREEGGIVLEAALILPLILLVVAFMLAQIRSVRYEMLVAYALDQTAEEAAMLIPLGDALLQGVGLYEFSDKVRDWLPGEALTDQLLMMATDISSSLLFGRFVHSRIDFWLDEAVAATGFRLPPFEKRLALFWQGDGNGLVISLKYDLNTAFFFRTVTSKSLVPLWTEGQTVRGEYEAEAEDETYDPIWSMSNFDRGAKFRTLYGANLPFTYPVIAAFNGGEAVSIKSMDLTAPSYQVAGAALRQIQQHAYVLEAFNGVPWGEYTISPGQIQAKKLVIIIPENAPSYADQAFFEEAAQRLRIAGVSLEVKRHGQSGRYADLNESGK